MVKSCRVIHADYHRIADGRMACVSSFGAESQVGEAQVGDDSLHLEEAVALSLSLFADVIEKQDSQAQ